jgi:MoCo/4Fe-4S cofactor protein with predicted Tat translocation signal
MSQPQKPYHHLDLAAIRARLEQSRGREYWRSLEELAATDGFEEMLEREFPRQAADWTNDAAGRRQFLKVMGASLALAGLSACTRQPTETIMPYVRQPEEVIPGKPLFFATAVPTAAIAMGVLVESHLGRPTKVEGNPDHPASLGATDAITQASILDLYDPDRSQTLTYLGDIRPWSGFLGTVREALASSQTENKGAGLRFLTGATTSPTLADQFRTILQKFPAAKWHRYEPAGRQASLAGARQAFGQPVNTYYQIANADVILALDADFLCSGPASVRYAADFAARRRVRGNQTAMNRLYVVESTATPTGAKADHRLPMRALDIEAFAAAVAAGVGASGADTSAGTQMSSGPHAKWIAALVKDLMQHRGSSVVIPGEHQPAAVHVLAYAINSALGNDGKTVIHTDALDPNPVDDFDSLRELVRDMQSGKVEMLVIVGGNPVYNAPVDIDFARSMSKVKLRIHVGLYADETSELCQWHVPEAHFLETWSDARAYDGTVTILQPLIQPLYFGRSVHELLGAFGDTPNQTPYEIVKGYWNRQHTGADFEDWWRKAVHDGIVPNTALPARQLTFHPPTSNLTKPVQGGLEIVFRTDPYIFDGRFANNGWLQELPKPLTTLTWDNAVLISPRTAERLQLQSEDLVELNYRGRKVRAPIWILPGHADESVTVHLGYGRTNAGRVGNGLGFNAYALRTSDAPSIGSGLEIVKTGSKYPLAVTQNAHLMEGRAIVISGNIDEYRNKPGFAKEKAEEPPPELTIYPGYKYEGYAWGMAIDQTACVGCNACMVACQSENNIPVVGKDQVLMRRMMHWLRVDNYYQGSMDNPQTYFQPVPCMHCENAPCELVCPVQATNHSSEGLNDMVYNRCVGTRYCSNNCPYKVRRFNFFLYSDWNTPSLKLQRNPDVSVRSRGVMEKCTYCVQRINEGKIEAEKEGRRVHDGEIQTACQGACPTQAIVFGDINDPASRVAKLKAEPLNYSLLAELNTRPRTTYLAALRNPNPEIENS